MERIRLDMCQMGMVSNVDKRGGPLGPVLKPTGMLTNSWCLQKEMALRCPGDHEHVHLVGGRASAAQEYPLKLCEAICRGIAAQKRYDLSFRFTLLVKSSDNLNSLSSLCCEASYDGMQSWPGNVERPVGEYPKHWSDGTHDLDGHELRAAADDRKGEEILSGELGALMVNEGGEWACDDVTSAKLDPKLVKEARQLEMAYFEAMKVYERVPRSVQRACGGKVIKTRWIDINKGDARRPNYRSRLVGKEFNTYADDSLYAATPPLEALRLIVSKAATSDKRRHIMINDVRRAYF